MPKQLQMQLISQMKLFLAIDITGSKTLKNEFNLTFLLKKFRNRQHHYKFLEELSIEDGNPKSGLGDDVRKNFLYKDLNPWRYDWFGQIEDLYSSYDGDLLNILKTYNCNTEKIRLWKYLGDSIVHVVDVSSEEELSDFLYAYTLYIRSYNLEMINQEKCYKLKGYAWTAGFPIRNRVVDCSLSQTFFKNNEGSKEVPVEDYLGPEMDAGFMLDKESWPGFITVSPDLLFFLCKNEKNKNRFQINLVGWKKFHGIWDERPYPIFWLNVHSKVMADNNLEFTEYTHSELAECRYLQSLKGNNVTKERTLSYWRNFIKNVWRNLPKHLGIVEPYIPNYALDNINIDHKELKQIIEKDSEYHHVELKDILLKHENLNEQLRDQKQKNFYNYWSSGSSD